MKYIAYSCDCGCHFAVHSFSDSNDLMCPACKDDTGAKYTGEFRVEEEKK